MSGYFDQSVRSIESRCVVNKKKHEHYKWNRFEYMPISTCARCGLLDYHPMNATNALRFEIAYFVDGDPGVVPKTITTAVSLLKCISVVTKITQNEIRSQYVPGNMWCINVIHGSLIFSIVWIVQNAYGFNWYDILTGIRYPTSLNI